jgi:hypothetical protein
MKGGNMKKRGLSAIVTTLIIILLVLVAVSGIWVVVSNFLDAGTETIELTEKCLEVDLSLVSVVPGSVADDYDVTLKRNAGGDTIGGIKLNIFSGTESSGVLDFGTPAVALGELETQMETITTDITAANRLEYTVFFLDVSGAEQLCPTTNSKDF